MSNHDMECGHCGRTWNDREMPTPAARCPYEYDHEDDDTPDFDSTTWRVGPHVLTAYRRSDGGTDWEVHTDERGVPNLTLSGGWGRPHVIAVSWPSIGANTPEDAQKFAAKISIACGAAETFRGIIEGIEH